jgi:hypothetical protein
MSRILAFCAICALLTGCGTAPDPSAGTPGAVRGYLYHDALHPNDIVSPSPQAIYNANHGVWLWPPSEVGRPG